MYLAELIRQTLFCSSWVKDTGMKLQQRRQVFREINPIVAAGVKVEFMRDIPGLEQFVQRFCARVKAVFIFRAAIKINLQSRKIGRARNGDRIILIPERGIEWRTKRIAKNAQTAELPGITRTDVGHLLDQCRAVGANG